MWAGYGFIILPTKRGYGRMERETAMLSCFIESPEMVFTKVLEKYLHFATWSTYLFPPGIE